MVNRPRGKGTSAESLVVKYLASNGFPWAERRSLKGAQDWGDVTGTPGLVWEVKYANGGIRMGEWIGETCDERENARADHGILVMKPEKMNAARIAHWFAAMIAWDFEALIKKIPAPLWCVTADAGFNQNKLRADLIAETVKLEGSAHFAVLNRRPPGAQDMPQLWYRVMYLKDAVTLVRAAGYGSPLSTGDAADAEDPF
jgi:hypothetical protein